MQKTKLKQTEIGEIPEDWESSTIADALNINPKRELKKGTNAKAVAMQDIKEFNKKIQNFTPKPFKGGSKFKNGDTLMARITPCLENGKTAFVDILDEDETGFGSTEFIVLSGKDGKTTNDFVYYLAISPQMRADAIQSMTGTSGRQRVQNDLLGSKEITIPTLSEQKIIAKILSDLDAKIELNQQMNKTLETIGQSLFKHWFIDFEFPSDKGKPYKNSGGEMIDSELGEIPNGWKVSNIGKEMKTVLGGTPSRERKEYWANGNIPWINSGEINKFPITEASEYITPDALKSSATQLMPSRTVVIPFVISINKEINISVLGIETCGNQSVLGIIENKQIPSEFIYYWIKFMKENIYSWATGGAQQHINKTNVDKTEILIPKKEIMQNYFKSLNPLFNLIIKNALESKNLSQIRDSLLPKLMSGKIRIR